MKGFPLPGPRSINRWLDEGAFSDLLELEEYLADFADLIVLFVESPGSIAEPGVFAATSAVRSKTLAIVNSVHPKESFISDGPVRRLKNLDAGSVWYYSWDTDTDRINDDVNIETFEDLSKEDVRFPVEIQGRPPGPLCTFDDSTGRLGLLEIGIEGGEETGQRSVTVNAPELLLGD